MIFLYFNLVHTVLNMIPITFDTNCQFHRKIQVINLVMDKFIIKNSYVFVTILFLRSGLRLHINRSVILSSSI